MAAAIGIVASGHPAVSAAAGAVLAAGGNAFDAAVAGGFVSAVAEPTLTGLGGGGFLLARTAAGEEVLFDFFVETPGRGLPERRRHPDFAPVTVRYPSVDQIFHVGLASVAVPGALAGYLHVHRRLGRLPLEDLLAPAVELAAGGVVLNDQQAYLVELLFPILGRTPAGRAIYAPAGRPLRSGERLVNDDLAGFLAQLTDDPATGLHDGAFAERIAADMAAGGGLVTADDLAAYRVVEREPLAVAYRGHRVLANPRPAFGGALVAATLEALDARGGVGGAWGSAEHLVALVEAMVAVEAGRGAPAPTRPRATRGTTHLSVSDAEGNAASMTTSIGEGSGYVVPGTGIMLDNMLGEDDLFPAGFHLDLPGIRVGSMMAPTIAVHGDEVALVAGSGGSKRIRTVVPQVACAVLELGLPVEEAVAAPRLHWDGEVVQAEPGFPAASLDAVGTRWPLRRWTAPNLYFGGAHSVVPGGAGAGDHRRGGAAVVVPRAAGRA